MEAKQTPAHIFGQIMPFAWTVTDTRLDMSISSLDTLVTVTLDIQPNPAAELSDELLLNGRGLVLISIEVTASIWVLIGITLTENSCGLLD